MTPIDIRPETNALCNLFGFLPRNVSEITITPREVRLKVFRTDDQGRFHINACTKLPAGDTHTVEVETQLEETEAPIQVMCFKVST